MKRNAILLAILVALGIILSLYVYQGIVEGHPMSTILFSIAFLITAMFAGKITAEFRALARSLRTRDRIAALLLPLTGDAAHASVLAEHLVLRRTTLAEWPEIPHAQSLEIVRLLAKVAGTTPHKKAGASSAPEQ